jgi:hypothetical protein
LWGGQHKLEAAATVNIAYIYRSVVRADHALGDRQSQARARWLARTVLAA